MNTVSLKLIRSKEAGAVMVEFALMLPLLIALAVPVFYVVWNMLTQTVITNAARELANLAARPVGYSATMSMHDRINAVVTTTPPLQMAQYGTIYVSHIQVDSCSGDFCTGKLMEKWRWGGGGAVPNPNWGDCVTWGTEQCDELSRDLVHNLPHSYRGKQVYIAEVSYRLPAWAGLPFLHIPGLNKEQLYAWAIF